MGKKKEMFVHLYMALCREFEYEIGSTDTGKSEIYDADQKDLNLTELELITEAEQDD